MSLRDLWDRMTGNRQETASERETEGERVTPDERAHVEESADELEADKFAGGHLGGIDSGRLLPGGAPPPQDAPPRD